MCELPVVIPAHRCQYLPPLGRRRSYAYCLPQRRLGSPSTAPPALSVSKSSPGRHRRRFPRPFPARGPHHPDRQRLRVHRPLRRRQEGKTPGQTLGRPRLRPGLRRARHRPPAHPTLLAANQRHGRALQTAASASILPGCRKTAPPTTAAFSAMPKRDACLHTFVADYLRDITRKPGPIVPPYSIMR